ncbi:MAG: winged helix-turn-helix domain-containing protein, partial [Elainella sp.]
RLRKKIEQDPTRPLFVKTVVGTGYKFEDGTD